MSEPDDYTPLLPQQFRSMQVGENDPEEVMAVQRFMLRVGGPTIAMKLLPGGANGKFDQRMAKAIEAYQDKFGIETPNKGVLDIATSRSMSELRGELSAQDRRPDVMEHLLSQMPQLPKHHLEPSEGPHAELRSAQYHALDATRGMKAQKPDKHVTEFIQEVLASRGYPLGPAGIDGKPGKFTIAALQDYQRDAGLMPIGFLKDGSLDPATLEMMRMDEDALEKKKMLQQPRLDAAAPVAPAASASIGGLAELASTLTTGSAGPSVPESQITTVTVPEPAVAAAAPTPEPWDAPQRPPNMPDNYGGPAQNLERSPYMRNPNAPNAGFQGNVSIHVGPVVEQGLFGRRVSPGINIKIF